MARATQQFDVPEFDAADRAMKAAKREAERRGLPSVEALVTDELAPKFGVSRNTVYKWLGAKVPKGRYWQVLSALADELRVPVEWLDSGVTWPDDDPRRDRIRELAKMEGLNDPRLLTIGAPSKVAVARRRVSDQGKRRTAWPVLSAGHAA